MISAVGSTPYSYYNTLNPTAKAAPPVASVPESTTKKPDPVADAVELSKPAVALMQQLLSSGSSKSDNLGLNGIFRKSDAKATTEAYVSLLSAAYSDSNQKAYEKMTKNITSLTKPSVSKFDIYNAVSDLVVKN